VKFTNYDLLYAENEQERIWFQKALVMQRCPVCRAKAGEPCRYGKRVMRGVHMGRLPDGFDSADAVDGKYEPAAEGGQGQEVEK
jgi:hypothetical protein